MTPINLALFITSLIAIALLYRRSQKSRVVSERNRHLAARQVEIQSLLDDVGEILESESTTLESGNVAAASALEQLHRLNPDGSLDELIADTELFVQEWRVSRMHA